MERGTVWIGMGVVMSVLGVGSADVLALLRAYACSHDRTVDDLAQQLVDGDLVAETLRG